MSMIPKSGNRFSVKIMLKKKKEPGSLTYCGSIPAAFTTLPHRTKSSRVILA
jgi:hypothetical protein